MMPHARKDPIGRIGDDLEQIQRYLDQEPDPAVQLKDQLADLILSADEQSFDSDQLDALLSALEEHEPFPEEELPNAEESLRAFRQEHAPLFNGVEQQSARTSDHLPERRPIRRKLAVLLPLTAVIVILLGSVSAQALGFDLFGLLARWSSEIFHFAETPVAYAEITKNPLAENEGRTYSSPQAMLEDFGITAPLLPTWAPERLGTPKVWAKHGSMGLRLYVEYEQGSDSLMTRCYQITKENLRTVEKDEENVVRYTYGGCSYYIVEDIETTKAIWQNGSFECKMTGTVSQEEIEQMIRSIYGD